MDSCPVCRWAKRNHPQLLEATLRLKADPPAARTEATSKDSMGFPQPRSEKPREEEKPPLNTEGCLTRQRNALRKATRSSSAWLPANCAFTVCQATQPALRGRQDGAQEARKCLLNQDGKDGSIVCAK
uniref:Uncharacterized protein n=1 Tax=Sphaerodactylus townsendi TaxID=933632 RepID=A0ACB8FD95_9SAUR